MRRFVHIYRNDTCNVFYTVDSKMHFSIYANWDGDDCLQLFVKIMHIQTSLYYFSSSKELIFFQTELLDKPVTPLKYQIWPNVLMYPMQLLVWPAGGAADSSDVIMNQP